MAVAVANAALVARAQAGDEAAFEVIFNQYHAAIYNYVFRMMGNPEDASDLTQDTFLKAWRALSRTSDDLRVGPGCTGLRRMSAWTSCGIASSSSGNRGTILCRSFIR